jgi:hypothetical protein
MTCRTINRSSASPASNTKPAAGGCARWPGAFVSSRTGERDTAIYLQLELNGLASVGSSADAFLEEAIRGYSFSAVNR